MTASEAIDKLKSAIAADDRSAVVAVISRDDIIWPTATLLQWQKWVELYDIADEKYSLNNSLT